MQVRFLSAPPNLGVVQFGSTPALESRRSSIWQSTGFGSRGLGVRISPPRPSWFGITVVYPNQDGCVTQLVMKVKLCTRCGERKGLKSFASNKVRGKPQAWCRDCVKVYDRERFQRIKKDRYRLTAERRKSLRDRVDALKKKIGACVDCGKVHPPWAMDFDHRDPSVKKFNIGDAASKGFSVKKIEEEIQKCDLVCALCHRYRTHDGS